MILTDIGEVGVHWDGRELVLRPSLYAMSQVGSPAEIVATYARLMDWEPSEPLPMVDALSVLFACGDADEVAEVFGVLEAGEDGKFHYTPGKVIPEDAIHIARCLIKHGVTGALPPPEEKVGEEREFVGEFDARGMVAMAMAHLGLNEREAWAMTMTGMIGALRAKYPPPPSERGKMTRKEFDEAMEWLDKVDAQRKREAGLKVDSDGS